jgi:hypothetical protein
MTQATAVGVLEQSGRAADETFSSQPAAADVAPCTRRDSTWIDIELLDPDGKPVPNRKVRLTFSDGRVVEGTTDAEGLFGLDGIDPGDCELAALDLAADHCEMLG